jgi:hypothetical protein
MKTDRLTKGGDRKEDNKMYGVNSKENTDKQMARSAVALDSHMCAP